MESGVNSQHFLSFLENIMLQLMKRRKDFHLYTLSSTKILILTEKGIWNQVISDLIVKNIFYFQKNYLELIKYFSKYLTLVAILLT